LYFCHIFFIVIKEILLRVLPQYAENSGYLKDLSAKECGVDKQEIRFVKILKRSIDARQREVYFQLKLEVFINEDFIDEEIVLPSFDAKPNAPKVIIIGAGPAGLFAALRCLETGVIPVILERGKDVKTRVADLKEINLHHLVNPDSNYCFGEGGAGTYSDGKLYTRSKKRGDVEKIVKYLVAFGADKNILAEAHPHIGTNKLPGIIKAIRECIVSHGGEIHFNSRVTDLLINEKKINGIILQNGSVIETQAVILATGHSARDVYYMLKNKNLLIEEKPFALGVRVEHPQELIDSIQYKRKGRGEYLPPAAYSVVKQVNGRGVYSFCMCPGGVIAPCATDAGEVVTNGWSPSRRDFPTANSGIVVELKASDFKSFSKYGALSALEFQKSIEHKAWLAGGKTQVVPAMRLTDFLQQRISKNLPLTSYKPGIIPADFKHIFPEFIISSLQKGFQLFEQNMKGFITEDAILHAPESRTSSPVRIPRDVITLEHVQVIGLYPCGEGAGYAGGIISAALDGDKCAEKACGKLTQ
jgi:uncharacterized FAD-dependent dehydrogenase